MLKHHPKLKKIADKHGLESKEFVQELVKVLNKGFHQKVLYNKITITDFTKLIKFAIMHCNICGAKLIPDKQKNKKWDGFSYRYPCSCYDKNLRVSSG